MLTDIALLQGLAHVSMEVSCLAAAEPPTLQARSLVSGVRQSQREAGQGRAGQEEPLRSSLSLFQTWNQRKSRFTALTQNFRCRESETLLDIVLKIFYYGLL